MRIDRINPRKPISGIKKIGLVKISGIHIKMRVYLGGIGNKVELFSRIKIKGGKVNDTPGIKLKMIIKKNDVSHTYGHKKSKYGFKGIKKINRTSSNYGLK